MWGELPAVVCIHGGGWTKGDRTSHSKVAQALASRGYVAATISYRLSGEAPFPAAIHDCKAAVRYLRANAKTLGIDPHRIGAIGLSAGGHLTALLATSSGVDSLEGEGGHADVSSAIQAAIPMGAQTDLLSERTAERSSNPDAGKIWRQFLGGTQTEREAAYRLASPIEYVRADAPPFFFFHGTNDFLVPQTISRAMSDKLRTLGATAEYLSVEGKGHMFTFLDSDAREQAVNFLVQRLVKD